LTAGGDVLTVLFCWNGSILELCQGVVERTRGAAVCHSSQHQHRHWQRSCMAASIVERTHTGASSATTH